MRAGHVTTHRNQLIFIVLCLCLCVRPLLFAVEGVIRFVLNDRHILVNIPTELLQTYTIKNVTSPPPQRLKLEWV